MQAATDVVAESAARDIDGYVDGPPVGGEFPVVPGVRVPDHRAIVGDEPWKVAGDLRDATAHVLDRRRFDLERDDGVGDDRRVDRVHRGGVTFGCLPDRDGGRSVVPHDCAVVRPSGSERHLHVMWLRLRSSGAAGGSAAVVGLATTDGHQLPGSGRPFGADGLEPRRPLGRRRGGRRSP